MFLFVLLKICCLMNEELLTFAKNMPVSSKCSGTNGWFTAEAISMLRDRIVRVLLTRVELFLSTPINTTTSSSSSYNPSNTSGNEQKLAANDEKVEEEVSDVYIYSWVHRYLDNSQTMSKDTNRDLLMDDTWTNQNDYSGFIRQRERSIGKSRKLKRRALQKILRNDDKYTSSTDIIKVIT